MSASAPQNLTKKQRKGLAFRHRNAKRGLVPDAPGGEVSVCENQGVDGLLLANESISNGKGKSTADAHVNEKKERGSSNNKKRKRVEAGRGGADRDDAEAPPKPKKQKRTANENSENGDTDESAAQEQQHRSRFILFIGNLKYTTSKDAILAHFAVCDPPPQVRLLTPKSAPTAKSKGCAFLEFSHRNALQQALKLHQSELEGRRINVELTAGGGGKGEKRLGKLKDRNRGLATQRTKLLQKSGKDGEGEKEHPQRHSTTSGVEEIPLKKRTWSIPETSGEGTHRGGKRHEKKRSKRQKEWGTGVNAIPVG